MQEKRFSLEDTTKKQKKQGKNKKTYAKNTFPPAGAGAPYVFSSLL
jgi:hypothetical protein